MLVTTSPNWASTATITSSCSPAGNFSRPANARSPSGRSGRSYVVLSNPSERPSTTRQVIMTVHQGIFGDTSNFVERFVPDHDRLQRMITSLRELGTTIVLTS